MKRGKPIHIGQSTTLWYYLRHALLLIILINFSLLIFDLQSWIIEEERFCALLWSLWFWSILSFQLWRYKKPSCITIMLQLWWWHIFCLGARRGWCGNLTGQVDMCHNFFLDHIMQKCSKIVYGSISLLFIYLCHLLGPMLSKKDTKLRLCIPIECRISLTLHRLATGDTLHTLADLYGISKSSEN